MAIELKDATDRYQLLEEESRAKATDLEKALVAAKEARSKIRATKEELNQAADIVSGKPFLLRTKFGDPKCRISGSGRPLRFEHWGARGDFAFYLPAPLPLAKI